jgi:two-component system, OmpR family, phosphate regulon response regulator PhoB
MSTKNTYKPNILIVEDEEPIALLVQYNLEKAGYDMRWANTGGKALDEIEKKVPDLILMDWMLPEISGIELTRQIRKNDLLKGIPIIMLTARGQEEDKIKGFDAGVDDYVLKPFSVKELSARIKTVLRRVSPKLTERELIYGPLKIDNDKKQIFLGGKQLEVTHTEYLLLQHFVESPERVFSREQLLTAVWKNDDLSESRTVDVHIRRIRAALGKISPSYEDLIKTVRGEGYSLQE